MTHRLDPFRGVRWRFDRVQQMVDQQPKHTRCHDKADRYLSECREYLIKRRKMERTDNVAQLVQLAEKHPGLDWAYSLYRRYPSEVSAVRQTLEARILAGTPFDWLARNFKTTIDSIRWYEALFFDVLDRIEAKDWIVEDVIRPWLTGWCNTDGINWEGNEQAFTVKLMAYFGGPWVLEYFLRGFNEGAKPSDYVACREYGNEHFIDSITRRSAMASRMFHINRYNVMQLFEIHTKLIELARAASGHREARDEIEKNIAGLVGEIPFAVGVQGRAGSVGRLEEFDQLSAEFRDDELQLIFMGQEPENYEELKTLRLTHDTTVDGVVESAPVELT